MLIALLGLTAGQAVIWYTGQFYALFFLERVMRVDATLVYILLTIALLAASPFFIFFGWLSDKVGRKPIILAGCLLAAITYFPLFNALTEAANPRLAAAAASAPVTVYADPADCHVQFDPVGKTVFNHSCDLAKSYLAKAGVTYTNVEAPAGTVAEVRIGDQAVIQSFRGQDMSTAAFAAEKKAWDAGLGAALTAAGYPAKADSALVNKPMVVLILFILGFYVTMVYGPIAAALVEMFPTNIRYTSMSLPYHIGNGWFGGFLPTTAFAIVAATGNIYSGLWYPIIVALGTVVLGFLLVKEGKDVDLNA